MAETTAPPKPSVWRRKEAWGPVAVIAAYALLTVFANPTSNGNAEDDARIMLIGMMISLPMQCAVAAAWAPTPVVTRWAAGIGACVLLGIAACAANGRPEGLVMFASLFVPSAVGFAMARTWGGWRLGIGDDATDTTRGARTGHFTVRYLMILTACCAVLLSLGLVTVTKDSAHTSAWEIVKLIFLTGSCFTVAMLPPLAAGLIVLGPPRGAIRGLVLLAISLAAVTASMTFVVRYVEPASRVVSYTQLWAEIAAVCLGATLSCAATAWVMRWCGYRLVRGEASDG
ncbi:hypothetical protein Mal64_29320 [Pseudobythopirellula maris]|uniref:Uncharacterized protein n=1 Tax=Pseudobythopirellula maris TaxID=2527991 RepID=A0A5C5ZLS2_9BACT|nr:hypothetical protein [Pseudobythopirellula maris]TWT87393.1 hypothetical protein Mal64_29320 [Pseudobythopirellula maris]